MTKQEIEGCLNRALVALFKFDAHLLSVDSSERSITHRLAVHLMPEFSGYDVDCEYNRDGFDVKRLELNQRDTTDNSEEAVTVFPDIVVHLRGSSEHNLLVVEMKKVSSAISPEYDIRKLNAFHKELKYEYAVHVTVGMSDTGRFIRKLIWVNGN